MNLDPITLHESLRSHQRLLLLDFDTIQQKVDFLEWFGGVVPAFIKHQKTHHGLHGTFEMDDYLAVIRFSED